MANSWVQLVKLLPKTVETVGKVLSINSTLNTAVCQDISGGTFVVNFGKGSEYVVNNWVLIRDNLIISTISIPEGESTPGVAKDIAIN